MERRLARHVRCVDLFFIVGCGDEDSVSVGVSRGVQGFDEGHCEGHTEGHRRQDACDLLSQVIQDTHRQQTDAAAQDGSDWSCFVCEDGRTEVLSMMRPFTTSRSGDMEAEGLRDVWRLQELERVGKPLCG